MRLIRLVSVLGPLLLAAGCATTPESIPDPGPDSPTLSDVREKPARYRGDQVRWGGTIAGVENRAETTLIEVVARELATGGRPQSGDGSPGRFLAVIDGFLDPAIHRKGRQITVTGAVAGITRRPVDEHDYRYVRVEASGHHLWPERVARDDRDRYWRHPPPFAPWHPRGYYPGHPFGFGRPYY